MNQALAIADVLSGLGGKPHDGLTEVTYLSQSNVFEEGDDAGSAYLIERGEIEIWQRVGGERKTIAVLGPGELFGEMASIDRNTRSATATVKRDADLIPIGATQLEQLLGDADPLLNLLLRVLLDRLRTTQNGDAPPSSNGVELTVNSEFAEARERALGQVQLERALRSAISRREFELYLQPIVRVPRGDILGFEGLIRWLSPSEGIIMPARFIDLAEATALIVPLGLWVLEHACHLLKRIQSKCKAGRCPYITVNVSARQLSSPRNVDEMISVIQRTGVDARNLKLEITEHLLVQNPEVAAEGLKKFRSLGAKIAIDDFGTGYSSLSYLHRFELDTLKVDRSFVNSMLQDNGSLQIVRAILSLAKTLDLDIIAEGVEREEEAAALLELGCDVAQGYLYWPPLPEEEALALLKPQG